MKKSFFWILATALFTSSIAWACPDGQYEMCVLPRPWGGCAQKVCVPNGGTIIDGASDGLADLNQGVIRLGNGVVNAPAQVGKSLGRVASNIDWNKVDWGTGLLIVSAIANGAACLASDGASPGQGIDGATVGCSENACACAGISLAMAVKRRSNMSDDEKAKTEEMVNNPQFEAILQRPEIISATTHQLSSMGIYRRQVERPDPRPCPRCMVP